MFRGGLKDRAMSKDMLHEIILDAIEQVGLDVFKKTSFFGSNSRLRDNFKKAA